MTNTKLNITFPQVTQALIEGYIAPLHHNLKHCDIKSMIALLNEKLSVIQSLEDKVSQLEQAAEAAKNQPTQEVNQEAVKEDFMTRITRQLSEEIAREREVESEKNKPAQEKSVENDHNADDSFFYVNSEVPFPTEDDLRNEYHEYDQSDDIENDPHNFESQPVAPVEENQEEAQDTTVDDFFAGVDFDDETPKEEQQEFDDYITEPVESDFADQSHEQEQEQNDDEIDEETAIGMDMDACLSNLTQEQQAAIKSYDIKFDEKKYTSSDFASLGLTSLASATKKKADLSDDLMLIIVKELNEFKGDFNEVYKDDEIAPSEAFDKALISYKSACRDLISTGITESQLTDSIPKHANSLKNLEPGMLTWNLMYVNTVKRGLSKLCA